MGWIPLIRGQYAYLSRNPFDVQVINTVNNPVEIRHGIPPWLASWSPASLRTNGMPDVKGLEFRRYRRLST